MFLRPIASHAHDPTSSMGDDTALPPLAGRRAAALSLLQAALRPGHQPADRPPARALRDVAAHPARRPGAAPDRRARGCRLHRARRASSSSRRRTRPSSRPSRLDATFDAGRGSRGRCERPRPTRRERPSRAGAGIAPDRPTPAPRACPVPALLATAPSTTGWSPRGCERRRRSSSRRDEPREVHHFACLLGYGAEAICPRLALRRWPRWPPRTRSVAIARARRGAGTLPGGGRGRRPQGRCPRWASPMSLSYCGAQIFEALGLAPEVVDLCFVGTPSPDRRHRLRRARAGARRALARAPRRRQGDPREPWLRQVAQGRRAARDEWGRRRRAHEMAAARRRCRAAVRNAQFRASPRGLGAYENFASLVNEPPPMELRDLLELSRPASPSRSTRSSRPRRSCSASRAAPCRTASLSAEAHETLAHRA